MMKSLEELFPLFCDYLEYYPDEDDDNYDGIHSGGWKGIKADAPPEAVAAFKEYEKIYEEAAREGLKL